MCIFYLRKQKVCTKHGAIAFFCRIFWVPYPPASEHAPVSHREKRVRERTGENTVAVSAEAGEGGHAGSK